MVDIVNYGLVCAAAVLAPVGPIGSYAVADFRRTLDVNVVGTLLAIRACLPGLLASGGAVVTDASAAFNVSTFERSRSPDTLTVRVPLASSEISTSGA